MQGRIIFMMVALIALLAADARAAQLIRLATAEREPYIGLNLPNHGYVSELVTEAFKRVGYDVEIAFYPWARAVMKVEKGQQDGLLPVYYDASLTSGLAFSDPFPGGKIGLLKKKTTTGIDAAAPGENQTDALRRWQNFVFGVVRGLCRVHRHAADRVLHGV